MLGSGHGIAVCYVKAKAPKLRAQPLRHHRPGKVSRGMIVDRPTQALIMVDVLDNCLSKPCGVVGRHNKTWRGVLHKFREATRARYDAGHSAGDCLQADAALGGVLVRKQDKPDAVKQGIDIGLGNVFVAKFYIGTIACHLGERPAARYDQLYIGHLLGQKAKRIQCRVHTLIRKESPEDQQPALSRDACGRGSHLRTMRNNP
jgi:hypothetical protein